MNRQDYRPRLLKHAFSVSRGSAEQFSTDDQGLQVLLERLGSEQYIVTKRSERVMEEMLSGICEDGAIYKEFEEEIEPLCDLSARLREMSKLADSLADKTKEESIDVARALTIRLPTRPTNN